MTRPLAVVLGAVLGAALLAVALWAGVELAWRIWGLRLLSL